ncbi:MAG: insulinase family protein [Proteobacteria bacterium]|nr:insulinase family protein [Pseudomonadota bacterium]
MNHSFRAATLLMATTIILILAAEARSNDELSSQVDISYETFELANGLTVLVHTDHSTPTVFVGMWYGVGSKDEPEGKTGFAHLFEHLMFQSSENHDGEFFSPFTDAGATGMNGTTNSDRTNYYATVPSGAIDMALWMESDRMAYLLGAVTQDVLDEQRDVVKNEKRQRETRPYAKMGDMIRAGLYPVDHPYRHSTIGSMDDLDAASLEDVHAWFNKYYGASNVVMVLAGDISIEDAKEKVEFYFGEAPAGVPLSHAKKWIPNLAENREEMMYDKVGQIRISRTWALPGLNDKDTTVMYLVNDSLLGNKNSPLHKKLVDELQLATRVSGSAYGRVMSGEYNITIDLREGVTPEQVLPILDATIADYLASGPDSQILENAKLSINMGMLAALETSSSIGRILAAGQLLSNNPLYVNQELEWINAATAKELQETARRWLTRGYYQLTVKPFPEYTVAEAQADRSSIPMVVANSNINFPDIETAMLDNGMKLVVATRGNVPLVDVSIQINTGSTAAPDDAPGLASFVFGLLDKGTKKYDANELAAVKDKIGMSVRSQAGLERSSLRYRILNTHLRSSLDLAAEILRNPIFPEDELIKFQARVSAWLANLKLAPTDAAGSLFDRAVYGATSRMGAVWTPQLVEQVDRAKLAAFHRAEVTPDNMTVYLIGNIGIDEAKEAVEKAFGKWTAKANSGREPIGSALVANARVILVDYPDAESSTIYAGHAIEPYDAETWTELSIMNRAFGGGFESRLNMNLREDKGWSYGYRSGVTRNASGDMTLASSGQVQTDKTMESMMEIMREFEEYVSTRPATSNEIERIKLNRTRSLPGSFSTNAGFLASIIFSDSYGLPFDYAESSAARIESVTVEGVNNRARMSIDPSKLIWVVVGDLEKIEAKVRSLDYGEVEVWDAYGNKLR